jgi:membrane-associated phospholipid phosphatase
MSSSPSSSTTLSAAPGWSIRLARGVSYVISPLLLPPVLFGLALGHVGAGRGAVAWGVGLGVVFFALVPLGLLLWMVRRGQVRSIEVRERARRWRPFLASLGTTAVAFVLAMSVTHAGQALLAALIGCQLVNTAVLLGITLRWKISIHAVSIAGFVAALAFIAGVPWPGAAGLLDPGWLLALVPLIPLVGWARVRLRAHTWAQVLGGTAFGLVVPYAELALLWHLGWLGV